MGLRKETAVGRDARRHLHQPQHLALPGLLVDDEQSATAGADVEVPAALNVVCRNKKALLFISFSHRQGRERYASARAADSACTKHTQTVPRRGCGCG